MYGFVACVTLEVGGGVRASGVGIESDDQEFDPPMPTTRKISPDKFRLVSVVGFVSSFWD